MQAKSASDVRLQERDYDILKGLFEARVMTRAHISRLYFNGKEESAKKRVQKLKAAGFIRERQGRKAYEMGVLSLTRRAFETMNAEGKLSSYPPIGWKSLEKRIDVSDATLVHELTVLDAKAALAPAIETQTGLAITEFSVWPRLCEFSVRRDYEERTVRPDGLLRIEEIEENSELLFFLEVDRGTEEHETLIGKALDYWHCLKHGDIAGRLGQQKDVHFRVLFVFKTPTRKSTPSVERRNNVAERLVLCAEPFGNFIWMTTAEELSADPLGSIWVTPATYRVATSGTQYEPSIRRDYTGPYVRRPDRERFIEETVLKRRLLE